jgi:dihydrofolate synthase / folylpolyglutamate synthase
LAALGHPEQKLPPVVHVAGTNGKGSTLAFLRAALEAAGFSAHVYTSPHLVRFNERIVAAGRIVDNATLAEILTACELANGGAPITFFEITTVAAFVAFARTRADYALIEVGLGGRLDATNLVERPAVTAITPVSLDHQHYLGTTLDAIAGEKAGILKPGVTGVIGPQPPEAMAAIARRAGAIKAPLYRHGTEWFVERAGNRLRYRGRSGTHELPLPNLEGAHQIDNAGLALACLEILDAVPLYDDAVRRGLINARWPARLQRLTHGPLVETLPPGTELWLDGGHNPAAGEALAQMAEGWRDKPLGLVVGMLDSKDSAAFLAPLARHVAALRTVTLPGEHAFVAPATLAAQAAEHGIADAAPAADTANAVASLAATLAAPARILICGSLYLAGAVLAENG